MAHPFGVPTCYYGERLVCVSRDGVLIYQMDDAEMDRLGTACLNESVETDLETVTPPSPSFHKMLQEGQLLIQHEDKTYNVIGMEVK